MMKVARKSETKGKVRLGLELDYRDFLWRLLKSSPKKISLEALAEKSGCVSKSYLSMVFSKQRNLTPDKAIAVGRAVGMKGNVLRYYETLVQLQRAKQATSKEFYWAKLAKLPAKADVAIAKFDDARLLSSWLPLVIRELMRLPDFSPEPSAIQRRLRGVATISEIKSALDCLLATKSVEKKANGTFRVKSMAIRSPDEVQSIAIRAYHRSCLELGMQMLGQLDLPDREFGSLNLSVSQSAFRKIKDRVKQFREEILALAIDGGSPTQVAQLNIQFFSLSEKNYKGKSL